MRSRFFSFLSIALLISLALTGCQGNEVASQTDQSDFQANATQTSIANKTPRDQIQIIKKDDKLVNADPAIPVGSPKEEQNKNSTESKTEVTPAITEKPKSVVPTVGIAITPKGFQPATLTIAPGTKVIFINTDAEKHWPASDNHPAHKTCPGFDAAAPLAQNETYGFIFKEPRVCPFHDHLNEAWKGTITVK